MARISKTLENLQLKGDKGLLRSALARVLEHSTRRRRASSVKKYLEWDLSAIEKLAKNALDATASDVSQLNNDNSEKK